jgi:choline kinase
LNQEDVNRGTAARARTAAGRTGLILAAGYGSRHAVGGQMVIKPLLPVRGRALILRSIDGLRRAGCTRVVVVLGHEGDQLRTFISEACGHALEIVFVHNSRFDLHNGVSVLAAREVLPDEFVLAMADHVFDRTVMDLLAGLSCPAGGACLIVDSKLDSILDMHDATKVVVKKGRVIDIGKELKHFNAVDCGVFLAGPALLAALAALLRSTDNASLSDGVRVLAAAGRMYAVDLGSARWQDVDTPEMLAAAERMLDEEEVRSGIGGI